MSDGQPLFPGDSEIDQLFKIQKVMGELPSHQQEDFAKNPRFIGLKFPDLHHPETLEKKYIGKLPTKAINLMQGMLRLDPEERLTAIECLTHSYFDDLRLNDEEFLKNLGEEQSNDIIPETVPATRPIQSS